MPRALASEDKTDSRELILQAALQCFSEKGYDGSSTRDIATRAGVNQGLISYYFGGKLKLWQAAVDRAFEKLSVGVDAVRADPGISSERERIALLLRNYVRFVAHNPEFVRLMHEEGKRRGPRMRWLVDRHVKPMYEAMTGLIQRDEVRARLPRDMDPIHLHYLVAGAVGLIFHQAEECKRLAGIDPFDEAVVEEHARIVEHFFLGPQNEEDPS